MSQVAIEINEKTAFEKGTRVKHLGIIAKLPTEDLALLSKVAQLPPAKIAKIKKYQKYL